MVYLTSKTSPNQNYYGPTLSPINTRPSSSRLLSDQIPSLTNLVSLSFLRFLLRPWHHRWRRRLPLAICLPYLSIAAIAALSLPSINTTAIQRLRPLPPPSALVGSTRRRYGQPLLHVITCAVSLVKVKFFPSVSLNFSFRSIHLHPKTQIG